MRACSASSTLAYHQRFNLYIEEGDTTNAEAAIAAGLVIDPADHDLLFGRACLRLQAGKYASAWEERPTKFQLAARLDEWAAWNGADLDGKRILVCREQGYGDEIMFARYVKFLVKTGAEVIVYTIPRISFG
jgi:hypothetical protein